MLFPSVEGQVGRVYRDSQSTDAALQNTLTFFLFEKKKISKIVKIQDVKLNTTDCKLIK